MIAWNRLYPTSLKTLEANGIRTEKGFMRWGSKPTQTLDDCEPSTLRNITYAVNAFNRCFALRSNRPGRIYVFYSPRMKAYKVGYSKTPESRLKTIRTGVPDVVLVAVKKGCRKDETAAHYELSSYQLGGEWFSAPRDKVLKAAKMGRTHIKDRDMGLDVI